MPFNNNLDDLFREKDKELPAPTHQLDAHWTQLQAQLKPAAPRWRKRVGFGGGILLTGIILFFVLRGGQPAKAPAVAQTTTPEQPKAVLQTTTSAPVVSQPEATKTAEPVRQEQPKTPVAKNTSPTAALPYHRGEYIELPQEPQMFHINGQRDTMLECKNGTTIKIPAFALADRHGNVPEDITFVVQEYYRYEEVIAAGLNRNSEMKKKAITAGMVKFDAYLDDQKLDVKPGSSIEIKMRKDLINVPAGQQPPAARELRDDAAAMKDLNIHNLGWISYERFYNDTRPVTDLRIQIPRGMNVNKLISQLAFVSVQGVMPGYIENNQVVFYNIPIGEKAWFISLGESGKRFFSCVEQVEIKEKSIITPVYREASPEQFKRQLELLTALPVKE